tara:strand:- start:1103 stop:1279 length:177 start_codon:yes stop_codon:yes gene_type:complete
MALPKYRRYDPIFMILVTFVAEGSGCNIFVGKVQKRRKSTTKKARLVRLAVKRSKKGK